MYRLLYITSLLLFLVSSPMDGIGQDDRPTKTIKGKEFYVHKVQQGETLFSISQEYEVDIDRIKKANDLEKNSLDIGKEILIPVPKKDEEDVRIHKVEQKETLFGISRKYDVPIESLRKANPILKKEGLEVGMELKVPKRSTSKEKVIVHKVKKGETLYSICRKYQAAIDSVLSMNPFAGKGIKPGQKLEIPVGSGEKKVVEERPKAPFDTTASGYWYHRVKSGETLFSLSREYGKDIDNIKGWNPHIEGGLRVGQIIRIAKTEGSEEKEEISTSGETTFGLPDSLSKKGYETHKVQKGETLFSLSRKYGSTVQKIREANPHIQGEIKIGQVLRIPPEGALPISKKRPGKKDTIIFHEVRKGESLRSIAYLYGTSPALIMMANDKFFTPIHPGEVLIVPIPGGERVTPPSPSFKLDTYKVTLLLPFYLSKNDSILENRKPGERPEFFGPSKVAIEFYEGFRIALDSLKEKGLSVDLHVIETRKDDPDLAEKLEKDSASNTNLFVGPFYRSNLKVVAEKALSSQSHLVCPVPQSNKILLGNPYVSKVIPSPITLIQGMAEYIGKRHPHHNVILVDSKKPQDDKREKVFTNTFQNQLFNSEETYRDSLLKAQLGKHGLTGLKGRLKKDTLNVLVVPSQDQVFASDLMTRLNHLRDDSDEGKMKEYPIVIYGSEEWLEFESIDMNYKERFNLRVVTNRFIDHEATNCKAFMKAYFDRNHTIPGKYGFLGYDVGRYYLTLLLEFGTNFWTSFGKITTSPIHTGMDLYKTGVESGFENRHYYILEYNDLRLKRIY